MVATQKVLKAGVNMHLGSRLQGLEYFCAPPPLLTIFFSQAVERVLGQARMRNFVLAINTFTLPHFSLPISKLSPHMAPV